MKLYAVSYDDQEVLSTFSAKQGVPFPLLSDLDSSVIRQYGILNDQIEPGDALLYGIPYPGVYVCDAQGVVTAKFFHDSYKKRDSAEIYLAAAMGEVAAAVEPELTSHEEDGVRVSVGVVGGNGSLRQGIIRQLLVRFEMPEGLHIYGEPVPQGMIPTKVSVTGPPGLVVESPLLPPTEPLHLPSIDVTLPVWSGQVDMLVPIYPVGELVSEVRPLDVTEVTVTVGVRYQACDEDVCLLPKSESFELVLPLDVIDIPNIGLHKGHGQREGLYDGTPHLKRLLLRKLKQHPLGFLRYLFKNWRLERAARKRQND